MVYRSLDPTIGRTVAIKAIRLTDFADPAERQRVRERLLQEARSAGLLSHPNIITIYDVLEGEGSAFIVMEYVQGPSLGEMLRSGRLPDGNQTLRYFGQIADALDYAHRKGVIHRDIKSANILISSEHDHAGLAKISDFGISKFISQDTTHSGTMIGTPNYMAPEQIQGLPVDGRSDQFSFAVVVYEMLTGTKPFRAESLATLFYQVCKQDPVRPHELNASLPAEADGVIARALAKDADGRFPSCTEFITALGEALNLSAKWQPARVAHPEADTMETAAAAAAVSETSSFLPPEAGVRETEQPVSSEPVSTIVVERPSEPPFPPLSRRTRFADEYDRGGNAAVWGNRVLLILAAGAIIAALVFSLTKASSREPKAAAVTNPPAQEREPVPPATDTTPAPATEPQRSAPGSKPAGTEPAPPKTSAPAQEVPAPLPVPVNVLITSQPSGARIVIDNRSSDSCQAPCNTILAPGRHTLTAELNGFDTARRIFTVPDEKQVAVFLSQSMGILMVTTEPGGSRVTVDGKEYGVTPITIRLPVGTHQLTIESGAGRHAESVQIENDQFTTRSFRWQ